MKAQTAKQGMEKKLRRPLQNRAQKPQYLASPRVKHDPRSTTCTLVLRRGLMSYMSSVAIETAARCKIGWMQNRRF